MFEFGIVRYDVQLQTRLPRAMYLAASTFRFEFSVFSVAWILGFTYKPARPTRRARRASSGSRLLLLPKQICFRFGFFPVSLFCDRIEYNNTVCARTRCGFSSRTYYEHCISAFPKHSTRSAVQIANPHCVGFISLRPGHAHMTESCDISDTKSRRRVSSFRCCLCRPYPCALRPASETEKRRYIS